MTDECASAVPDVDECVAGGAVAEASTGRLEESAAAARVGVGQGAERQPFSLSSREEAWLSRMAQKQRRAAGDTSKYIPHQGKREKARRLTRRDAVWAPEER